MNSRKSIDILKIGVLIMILSVILVTTYFTLSSNKTEVKLKTSLVENRKGVYVDSNYQGEGWVVYTNDEFKFSLIYPSLLYKREYRNEGGFLYFIRFEENNFSKGKGIGLGIVKEELQKELDRIKKDLLSDNNTKLDKETKLKIGDMDGILLNFIPKDSKLGEEKDIFLFSRGEFTYSISTVPEQMNRILENFKFLN